MQIFLLTKNWRGFSDLTTNLQDFTSQIVDELCEYCFITFLSTWHRSFSTLSRMSPKASFLLPYSSLIAPSKRMYIDSCYTQIWIWEYLSHHVISYSHCTESRHDVKLFVYILLELTNNVFCRECDLQDLLKNLI